MIGYNDSKLECIKFKYVYSFLINILPQWIVVIYGNPFYRKEDGKVKSVKDLPPREQRQKRRQWRISKQCSRLKLSTLPPASTEKRVETPQTRQKIAGNKAVNRRRITCYRELEQTKEKLRKTYEFLQNAKKS